MFTFENLQSEQKLESTEESYCDEDHRGSRSLIFTLISHMVRRSSPTIFLIGFNAHFLSYLNDIYSFL